MPWSTPFDEPVPVRGGRKLATLQQAVAYLGPNGAGKSTTVKAIVGLLRPTAGRVRVCGYDIEQEPVEAKRRLGYVPDNAALFNTLTPNEYLSLIAELYLMEPAHARERMGQMMLIGAIVMQTIGYVWIRQVIKIEV